MTTAAAAMGRSVRGGLEAWCGWVMVGGCALVPLLAWLSPQGFAPLLAVLGLLCLPTVRITDEDRPALVVLLAALVWAAVSTTWSPYQPKSPAGNQALKLALELILYWSAVCGARRADPRLARLAMRVLAWGLAAFGAILLAESLTDGAIYGHLLQWFYRQPMRVDLVKTAVAHTTFAMAVLWPAVFAGGFRRGRDLALLALAVCGAGLAAHRFGADAPVLAMAASAAVIGAVWLAPRLAPWMMSLTAALLFLFMPLIVWGVRAVGHYRQLENDVQASWSARLDYWSHAVDWIREQPFRGWGLDASRMMGPAIQLHPHNGELQLWLELGVIGAIAGAVFWAVALLRLARTERSLPTAGVAGSAAAYLLFASLSFGIWQEWWLALGALIPVIAALVSRQTALPAST